MRFIKIITILIIVIAVSRHCCSFTEETELNDKIMKIDDLKPGMKGYGKTVFSGDKIETFGVEILGILKNYEAKSDMILVRLTGNVVEKAGIISGMSGSPIYIDDKIIGALSYAWAFSKEPIAGVTPIDEMLKVLEDDLTLDEENQSNVSFAAKSNLIKTNSTIKTNPTVKLTPIQTPLMVSGFDSRVFSIMGSEFDMLGMSPIQSGGSVETEPEGDDQLLPGSAVAAQLIRGDLNASAIGTVTYRKGSRILAFGHPFLQMGKINLPMAGAYVHATLSSISLSAKMASPTREIGRISQDRKAAIAGIIGEFSKMIPCRAKISGTRNAEYNFEVVSNKMFAPNLMQMAFLSSILASENNAGEKVVELGLSIFIDNRESPIVLKNIYYDASPGWYPVYHITQSIVELLNNSFKPVTINRVEFSANLLYENKLAVVQNIRVNKSIVSPGEIVNVSVMLSCLEGKYMKKNIDIEIPADVLPGSRILITACSSRYSEFLSSVRSPGKFKPVNFEQLVNLIENMELNNELIIRVLLPGTGVSYKGEQFETLPPSILSIMTLPNYSGTELLANEKIYRLKTDSILEGKESILLSVK